MTWMNGLMEVKAVLRIAYSNKKAILKKNLHDFVNYIHKHLLMFFKKQNKNIFTLLCGQKVV